MRYTVGQQYGEVGQHIRNSYKFPSELATSSTYGAALLITGHRCPQSVKERT